MEEMFQRVMRTGGPPMGGLFIQTGAWFRCRELRNVKVWVMIEKIFNLSRLATLYADVPREVLLDCYGKGVKASIKGRRGRPNDVETDLKPLLRRLNDCGSVNWLA